MKALIVIAASVLVHGSFAQCPYSAVLTSPGQCVGIPLTVNTTAILSQITWNEDGHAVLVSKAVTTARTGITIAGSPTLHGGSTSQLNNPIGLWGDANGNIYIVDRLNYRIQKWAPGASNGSTVAGGNGQGVAANQLSDPIGIFVDAAGTLYVDDYGNDRIQKWTSGASSGVTVAGGNGQGSAQNQLFDATGVFVDKTGNVFIADAGNNRIQEWTPGASTGITVAGGNGPGPAANQFDYPSGIFVDQDGNLYVADEKNNRVQKWASGASSGITVAGGNGAGKAANQLNTPYTVFVDRVGDVYVDDQVNARIQFWPNGATSGITVAGGNGGGAAANQLFQPTGVFVDANGVIYIADYGNNRVQKWAMLSGIANTYVPSSAGTYTAVVMDYNGCVLTSNPIVVNPATAASIQISATDTNLCAGVPVSYSAHASGGGAQPSFQWRLNGANTGSDSTGFTNPAPANSDVVECVMTSNDLCAMPAVATSNSIPIKVTPDLPLAISISADAGSICAGETLHFIASPSAGANPTDYHWQVNGVPAGADTSRFSSNRLPDGGTVRCLLTSPSSCLTATSNTIGVVVKPVPHVDSGQSISLLRGESTVLQPVVTGDIASWLWSPAAGLSDNTIRDPQASPATSIVYTLQVVGTDGCSASGTFAVKVSSPIRVPNAFTPNGDGRNDVFYVLGGPDGSMIRDLSVYSRSGQRVFHVHDVPPGDPAFGWNGSIKGSKAQTGNYMYVAIVALADGTKEEFKGNILLIR
ncbi:MAG: gliding motility-associated C-terminal domain-containing protein [Bacteroidota bacterium]|nr:gliding motility-associated C-terminal domain-containing protein [Bacteroidota bacterium]